jgi:hypothetical protein
MVKPQQRTSAIDGVIRRLCERYGRSSFNVVEQWDDDTCAVGVSGPADGATLVYISTCNLPEGQYDVTVESGDGEDHVVGLDFEGLATLVARHLQLPGQGGR